MKKIILLLISLVFIISCNKEEIQTGVSETITPLPQNKIVTAKKGIGLTE